MTKVKILKELKSTFEVDDTTKERQVVILTDDKNYIVLKVDSDKGWSGTTSTTAKSFVMEDENKATLWASKLIKDRFL